MRLFEQLYDKKTALYGLGNETEKVLGELGGCFEILGLLDSFKAGGEIIYGLPVISLPEAIEAGVQIIIVVARPGSCRAIAKKIGDLCRQCKIELFDIRGKDLLETPQVKYDFSHVKGVAKANLNELCDGADVVSFDLFETIVMRRIYKPTDMIQLVEARLLEKGIKIRDFCLKRLASEKELSKTYAPALVDIYRNVIEVSGDDNLSEDITAEYLAEVEWQADYEILTPRHEVAEVYHALEHKKKRVYVVSDTYYSKKQLSQILDKCGINYYTDILASCEFKTGKAQELYDRLKAKEPGKKILHIGDDVVADIRWAQAKGLAACHIYSGLDLMECLGCLGMDPYISSLSDKIRVGMFIADIFNSPFQFETNEKGIRVWDSRDIGYLFCAPVFVDFVSWFESRINEQEIRNIWFGARDGFLIQKMYRRLLKEQNKKDDSIYFLTSRTAAVRAGVQNDDDIRYVDNMKYHGDIEENLKGRFGIETAELGTADALRGGHGLLRYKEMILDRAEQERGYYKRYMKGLELKAGDIGFFDFVAKGTIQMYIQRLVDHHLKGLYFLHLEPGNEKCGNLDVESFCGEEEGDPSTIYDNYYILETLLTAPYPTVNAFDETGEPIYAEETRNDNHIACLVRTQDGILDYMDTYIRLCPIKERRENRKLDEVLLSLIRGVVIKDMDFLDLVVEDPFFNRRTNITDVF